MVLMTGTGATSTTQMPATLR
ncbi:hypothetical protein E2C01_100640 [Portunus trituberculatus]|uniref:Uncharacterized protein n=1 Tax=Portunus trituberculatus TaxID=210409 RepID=A0A5B7KDJ1_PORTR|nr:hypothetical protein [Portunus trituberculatus]